MSDSMFLSSDEVFELTKRRNRGSQSAVLKALGIDHKVRPDGSVVVLRRLVEQQFGITEKRGAIADAEPDWSAA